ncbi:helix-turn-helix domain-containing protein [Streptococcus suis]
MIGAFLKEKRIKEKIRVHEIADICGVSQPYISNVENEKRTPTTEMFFSILNAIALLYPITNDIVSAFNLKKEVKTDADEIEDYNNYEIYQDPAYVKDCVVGYWENEFLIELMEQLDYYDLSDKLGEEEATSLLLNSISSSELPIFQTILSLKFDEKYVIGFNQYIPPKREFDTDVIDLNLLDIDNMQKEGKVVLDGLKISKSDLTALRKVINGIRYDRIN